MAKTDEEKLDLLFKALMYGGAAFAIYKVGQQFGVFDTAEESAVEDATADASQSSTSSNPNNPYLAFNPNYAAEIVKAYNKKFAPKIFDGTWNMYGISQAQYLALATRIKNAKRPINDNEDTLYNVFRTIQTQWQLSFISLIFSYFAKMDLLLYLKGFLSPEELATILAMVKHYPQYRKK